MAGENPPKTKTGLPVRQTSRPDSAPKPTENERKLAELIRLGSHYWTPDFTRAQANSLLADYLEDLAHCTITQLEVACREWRRGAANTRFPRSAELVRAVFGAPERPARHYTWKGLPEPSERPSTKSVYEVLVGAGRMKAAEGWLAWKAERPKGN